MEPSFPTVPKMSGVPVTMGHWFQSHIVDAARTVHRFLSGGAEAFSVVLRKEYRTG